MEDTKILEFTADDARQLVETHRKQHSKSPLGLQQALQTILQKCYNHSKHGHQMIEFKFEKQLDPWIVSQLVSRGFKYSSRPITPFECHEGYRIKISWK